jgi:drug/metabolite transporter (DMT)-like permease
MDSSSSQFDDSSAIRLRGRLLVVTAAVMWSTSGLFAKAPLFVDWPPQQRGILLAFWRALFATLVLLPFVRKPRWHFALIPMVLAFAAMNYTFLSALTLTTAANAIWLQHTAPAWVFVIGVVFFRETVHSRDWVLLVCGVLGVGSILFFEIQGEQMAGIVFGLLSGLTYAGVILSIRQLRNMQAAWLIALNHLVTAGLFFPYVVHQGIWPSGPQLATLAGFGILQMGIPYVLFARGLRFVSGHEASGIALLEPLLVPLWVFLAWHNAAAYQPPRWWTFCGGGLILMGLVMRYQGTRRFARTPQSPD